MLFKPGDTFFNTETTCKMLNIFYPYMSSTRTSFAPLTSLVQTNHPNDLLVAKITSTPQPTVLAIPDHTISMCYDSGTFPTTLYNNPAFFSSITYFVAPKSVSLEDNNTLIPAIAEGIMDYIINDKV